MQFLKLPYDLITDKNITSNEFRIYTYLLSRYNKEKNCAYPSIEVIAKNINIGLTTVKASIKKLVKLGYMTIEKKKGINGNYNTYTNFKHIETTGATEKITSTEEVEPVKKKEVKKPTKKKLIVRDYKEQGEQMEIEDISPYTREHQSKIALVLKQNIKLTEKQEFLIGDMDLEMLRQAIFRFRKATKTNTFAFLLECYFTECSLNDVEISMDLQRYTGNIIVPVSEEYLENERVKELLIEDGIFDQDLWNGYSALGL